MDRRNVILLWLNSFPHCSPLKKLEELVDGNQLIELAAIINPLKCEDAKISNFASEKKIEFIKETILSHYHMDLEKLVNLDLFINGNVTETIKVALLLLSAVVIHLASSSSGKNVLSDLHKLEATLQEEIKNYLQMILEANDFNTLATVLCVLSCNAIETSMTPTYENKAKISVTPISHFMGSPMFSSTLKNKKYISKKLEFESPLERFMESPLLRHQIIIRKNEKEIKNLRNSLHFEENRVMELEEHYKDACSQICFKDEAINKLKEKIKYLEQFEVIVGEQNDFKTEYEDKITFLEKKYDHCRKCRYLENSKQETEEFQEKCTNLEETLRNMQIKMESIEKDNLEKEKEIKSLLSTSIEKNIKIEDLTQQTKLLTKCIEEYRTKYSEECAAIKNFYVEPMKTPQRCENETLRGIIDRKNQELEEQLKEKDHQIEVLIANLGCNQNWEIGDSDQIKMNMTCWLEIKENCITNSYEGKTIEAPISNDPQITDLCFVGNHFKIINENIQNKCVQCEEKFGIQVDELKRSFEKQLLNNASEINSTNETIKNYKQKISELEQHILLLQRNYESVKQEKDNETTKIKELKFEKVQEKLDLQEEIQEYKLHIEDLNDKITVLKKDCKYIEQEKDNVISKVLEMKQNSQKLLEEKEILNQSYQNVLLKHDEFKKLMNESLQWKEKTIQEQSIKINQLEESKIILEKDCEHFKREHESFIKIKELEYSKIRFSLGLEASRESIESLLERELSGYNYSEISMTSTKEVGEKSHISINEVTKGNYSETLSKLTNQLKNLRNNKIFLTEMLIQLEYNKKVLNTELETLKDKFEILLIENDSKKSSSKKQIEGKTLIQENQLKEIEQGGNETDNSKLIKLEKNTLEKQTEDKVSSQESIDAFKLLILEVNERFQNLKEINEKLKNTNLLHEFFEITNNSSYHFNELFLQLELLNENIGIFLEIYESLAVYRKCDKITYLKCHLSSIYDELQKSEIYAACEEQRFIDCRYELEHTKLIDQVEIKKDLEKQFSMRIEELEKVKNSEIEMLHKEKAELLKQLQELQKSSKKELTKKDENIKRLESKCDSYKNKVKDATSETKNLMEKLKKFNKKYETQESEMMSLSKKYNKAKENIKKLTTENDDLMKTSKNMTKLMSEIDILADHNQELKNELNLSRKDVSLLKQRIELVESAFKIQEDKNKKLHSELHVAQNEISELNETTNRADFHKHLSFSTSDPRGLKNSPLLKKGNLDQANIFFKPKLQETPLRSKNPENDTLKKEGSANFIYEDDKNVNFKTPSIHGRRCELQRRNRLCPKHLQSCYPIETKVTSPSLLSNKASSENSKITSLEPGLLSPAAVKLKQSSSNLLKNTLSRSSFSPFLEKNGEDSINLFKLYREMRKLSSTPK